MSGSDPEAHEMEDGKTPGQYWMLEWGIGKSLARTIEMGASGYFQMQTTDASRAGAASSKARVIGVGPEVTRECPGSGSFTCVCDLHETAAKNWGKSDDFKITLTRCFRLKRFSQGMEAGFGPSPSLGIHNSSFLCVPG